MFTVVGGIAPEIAACREEPAFGNSSTAEFTAAGIQKQLATETLKLLAAYITCKQQVMRYSLILIVHILAGTLGLLSGTAAILFRKGSRRHALAGKVFVASMFTMAVGAVYLAIVKHQPNNIGGGILTFYL